MNLEELQKAGVVTGSGTNYPFCLIEMNSFTGEQTVLHEISTDINWGKVELYSNNKENRWVQDCLDYLLDSEFTHFCEEFTCESTLKLDSPEMLELLEDESVKHIWKSAYLAKRASL